MPVIACRYLVVGVLPAHRHRVHRLANALQSPIAYPAITPARECAPSMTRAAPTPSKRRTSSTRTTRSGACRQKVSMSSALNAACSLAMSPNHPLIAVESAASRAVPPRNASSVPLHRGSLPKPLMCPDHGQAARPRRRSGGRNKPQPQKSRARREDPVSARSRSCYLRVPSGELFSGAKNTAPRISATAPHVMPMSAMLNAGQCQPER